MSDKAAIKVEEVYFTYPDGHAVLKGLSCEIKHGEKVALIGPNGAGKSTLMSHLNGVSLATGGRVLINGIEIRKENLTEVRRQVGIVFQDPDDQLFCPTVFDDVAFGPLNLGLPKDEVHQRVAESLALVGLEGFEERSSFHLSFGERKRLALATVLSYQPDILVFDEPSTNMDPLNRRKLIDWLQGTTKTVLLCTHDLDIALDVCDRVLVLADGRIVESGPASEILYDRHMLEDNNLELPLALMTHELLHDKLRAGVMDEEHRRIIEDFLHAHRHSHGPDDHEHVHLHAHDHDHGHMHQDGGAGGAGGAGGGEGHAHDLQEDHHHHGDDVHQHEGGSGHHHHDDHGDHHHHDEGPAHEEANDHGDGHGDDREHDHGDDHAHPSHVTVPHSHRREERTARDGDDAAK